VHFRSAQQQRTDYIIFIIAWEIRTDVQIAVMHLWAYYLTQQCSGATGSYLQFVLKMSASCFHTCLNQRHIVWWQSQWQTGLATSILQLRVLATQQHLESSFLYSLLHHSPNYVNKPFKQALCSTSLLSSKDLIKY